MDLGCRCTWEGAGIEAQGGWGLPSWEPVGELAALTRASCGHSVGLGAAPGSQPEGPLFIASSCQVIWFPRFLWTGVRWLHVYFGMFGIYFPVLNPIPLLLKPGPYHP